ncbi:MAG: hypothetical protein WAM28_05400 [Chlamydiales bacterium]
MYVGISIEKISELPSGQLARNLVLSNKRLAREKTDKKITQFIAIFLSLTAIGLSLHLFSLCAWTPASLPVVFYTAVGFDILI